MKLDILVKCFGNNYKVNNEVQETRKRCSEKQ